MTSMISRTMSTPARGISAARLAALWFGLQALWGALLGISLQARTTALHPAHALLAYGQVATLGALAAMIVQLIVGPLSDRHRRNGNDRAIFLVVGTVCGAAGIIAFYLAPTYAALLAATIFLQVGANIAIGPYQAIIPDYFSAQHAGSASAWMAALQSAGNACGALAATFIVAPLGAAAILAALFVGGSAITIVHMSRIVPRELIVSRIGFPPGAIDLFISRAILWIGFYTILGYMFFYVRDTLHLLTPMRTTGLVILVFTITAVAGAALSGRPADRLDRRLVVNIGTAIVTFALLAFIAVRHVDVLFGAAAAAGLGWGAFLTADWALGCAILPRNAMATAMGVWNIAVAGSQIAAPALASLAFVLLRPRNEAAPLYALALATVEVIAGSAWIWRLPRVIEEGATR